ncbi:2-amino-4-hydroxy-6-hydroxymethyldihydropteridinepyrophosphokinase [Legionella lansingensis]|uniref:2-amino-4-hydroxy-6-hydroxymethyldihydropteridine pyrophosphokinase n=1 Tax=Legionella lansingensis TaxID=45067 RepID=A0A0W0VSF3_9GAMM|nr:2-amino-4-hydroxy-6-hydroxymethyldihydropteridine diphosphokinase [Legionella lansingensis]KTD23100.1 2-amino-4-hydroxy-6- hydroxymethyldihydropteridine pyrophosphokinase [Legionella lansingensis]SNV51176.1 2-amino-4-hydroxy-6-hydroxymethyldihydropteridinepyrophosphokinase [Legionella lansingensis]
MNLCYLGLGSNLNSPERQLRQAIQALRQLPSTYLLKVARFYRNKAWGRKGQPRFYNTVALIQTCLTPQQLLLTCQKIERKQGRIRHVKWGSRTLDIDILLYGSLIIESEKLIIPHPRMHLRDFVILPLLEICPKPITEDKRLAAIVQKRA